MNDAQATQSTASVQEAPTDEQIETFHREGFTPYGRVIDASLLAELRSEYDRLFREAAARVSGRTVRNLAADGNTDITSRSTSGERMLQITQCCERSLIFNRVLYHPPILAMFRALIGPNIQLYHDQALFKPAGHGGPVPWHQDNGYWRCQPATLVSCWIALDDADADNGAMQLIPGSHLSHHSHTSAEGTSALLDAEKSIDASAAVLVPIKAGSCLFHHCRTLHYTAPNRSDRDRRAYIIHVMTPGTARRDQAPMPVGWSHPLLSRG
ncbi:phytanoyl-CoA dioxygenase [Planctomycetota bacterium]|nr:phytanoyl-CoA dioxygenase [Planctomycetota bacterium]